MSLSIVYITLVAPRALEEKLIESLMEHEATAAAGFIAREVVAYGLHVPFRNIAEQISGRVQEVEVTALLSADSAQDLIDHLGRALQGQRITYRMSSVTTMGSIA